MKRKAALATIALIGLLGCFSGCAPSSVDTLNQEPARLSDPSAVDIENINEADAARIVEWIEQNDTWLDDLPDRDTARPAFRAIAADLNGDGRNEFLLRYDGFWQGTGGGGLKVLGEAEGGLVEVARFSIGHMPVGILQESTSGWHDLTIFVSGGGAQAQQMRLRFDGESYPYNPSMLPAEPTDKIGTVAISEETPLRPID